MLWINIGGTGVYIMYWTLVSSLSQHISLEESSPPPHTHTPPQEYSDTINSQERDGRHLKNVYELLQWFNIKPRKYPKKFSKHFILVHYKLIGANILIIIFIENVWCASEFFYCTMNSISMHFTLLHNITWCGFTSHHMLNMHFAMLAPFLLDYCELFSDHELYWPRTMWTINEYSLTVKMILHSICM